MDLSALLSHHLQESGSGAMKPAGSHKAQKLMNWIDLDTVYWAYANITTTKSTHSEKTGDWKSLQVVHQFCSVGFGSALQKA